MRKNRLPPLCAAAFTAAILAACANQPSRSEYIFSTVCTITLYEGGKPHIYRDVFRRLREIENLMSPYLQGSDISRINEAAGKEAVKVADEVFRVVEKALYYAELSGGAFDPSIGPVVSLWGINGENPRVPSQEEIDEALPLVNWREIELNAAEKTVYLKKTGMILDLGAIAKGYAADEAAAVIRAAKAKRAVIDLGGDIVVLGTKPDKTPWIVGVQNPAAPRGTSFGHVETGEKAVVTSGVYERFFESGGARHHHLFSPETGRPAGSGLLSVTVIAGAAVDADALSTAAFVLGGERGMALIESAGGAEAVFTFEDRSVKLSGGAGFTLTDSGWNPHF